MDSMGAIMELETASRTMKTERRDFAEWHRGRSPYVFWALDVDLPAVRAELARVAAGLGGLLLDEYQRQPHVTLDLCGFPQPRPAGDDEFGAGLLEGQIARLSAAGLAPFEIVIGGLNSFLSAAYLDVDDPADRLATLRAALAESGSNRLFGDYVPHCTVGLYGAEWPTGEVLSRFRHLSDAPAIRVRIDRVSLMSYEPAAIAGRLQILGDFWLNTRRMHWRPAFSQLGLGQLATE